MIYTTELILCHKLLISSPSIFTTLLCKPWYSKLWCNKIDSLKCIRFIILGCKYVWMRKSEFMAKLLPSHGPNLINLNYWFTLNRRFKYFLNLYFFTRRFKCDSTINSSTTWLKFFKSGLNNIRLKTTGIYLTLTYAKVH